ncbi:MAG: DUF2079 domain-containing protein [Planctomycetaceae bacterium]|nr:DUF2079 domain-containing protein [Planctomycetaceae bacterium]
MVAKNEYQPEEVIEQPGNQSRGYLIAALALAAFAIIMFADVLFKTNPQILSYLGSDLSKEFIDWRCFGFEQLRHGNLALWNPHVYCGIPFFGGFQSALLYPLNFLFMILPPARAFNVSIVLHIILTGLFMFLWARHRGLKPQACFFSAVLLMFCGPYFMHICVGHVSNLCAMAWVPLVFLCIDGIFDKRSLNWVITGIAAVSMLILAGHPQYVFYTAVTAAVYCMLLLVNHPYRIRVLSLLGIMCVWAGLLVSVQLLTGLQESAYSIRGDEGLGFNFAAFFSFPPENLLTLIAPNFFGSISDNSYWGRCYLWEMSLFFSVTGFVLAIYGQVYGSGSQRRYCMTLIIVLFILAMGAHTPLLKFLYNFVPGFDKFRGNSKFIFPMTVFAVMLSGIGLHRLITLNSKPCLRWIIGIGFAGICLFAVAGAIVGSVSEYRADGWWHDFMKFVQSAAAEFHESYCESSLYDNSRFVFFAAYRASISLVIAAVTLVLLSCLFALKRRWHYAVYAVILLAMSELIMFAFPLRPTFDSAAIKMPQQFQKNIPSKGDFRILNMFDKNAAMIDGMFDVWGDDPGILRRYAYFMDFAENLDHDAVTKSFSHRFFSLLRLRYVIVQENNQPRLLTLSNPVLPRLTLVRDFQVMKDRDDILNLLASPEFDPNQTVILESQPEPLPQRSCTSCNQDTVKIIDESTDHLTIEADINSPAILLVTDAYHPNWKITALAGSSQSKYELLPADYVLRAVPLDKGVHRFRMEYRPTVFIAGMWISTVSLAAYFLLCLQRLYSLCKKRKNTELH